MDKATFKIDLTYLKDVASGSDEFMIDMIDLFLDQTPLYFEQMEQHIQEGSWSKVADIAHKIKPTLAFMGVDSAKDSMAEIEQNARNLQNIESIQPAFNILKENTAGLYAELIRVKNELQNPS